MKQLFSTQPERASAAEASMPDAVRKKRRRLRAAALLAVLALAAAAGFRLSKGGAAPASAAYQTARVQRRDLKVTVSGAATLEPAASYRVTALVSGSVLEAPFEAFGRVEAGDLLYSIDAAAVQGTVDAAALGAAQQELAYRQALEARTPTAPVSGTLAEIYVREGDTVNAGDALAKIMTGTELTADFLFPFAHPSDFQPGQEAEVFITGYEGSVLGSVTSVSDGSALSADGASVCAVRVRIPNPGALTDDARHTAQAVIGRRTSSGTAEVHMDGSAVVCAAAAGTVSGFSKLTGSSVAAGEALCTLSSRELEERIEAARLSLQSARLQIRSAESALERYQITAPISGTVIEKNCKAGDQVNGADSGALAVLYDLSRLKTVLDVGELDIGKVAAGQEVSLSAAALPGARFTGRVEAVGAAGKTVGGFTTYPVTVSVEEYGALRPGMNVSAVIDCGTLRDALCVPVDAISRGNTVLLCAQEDGAEVLDEAALERREVVLGQSDGAYVQIASGLEEGDTVAYRPTRVMEE